MAKPFKAGPIARVNMLERTTENWRPPRFTSPGVGWSCPAAAARRFFDLQAGSIWRDLKFVLPFVNGTVVDVGCGAQPYRSMLPNSVTYIGLDDVHSKGHFGYDVPDTRYFGGDQWPIADATAKLILCTETLEHVPSPPCFLREAFRCLAPGGVLVLTVPFAARWHFVPHDYWRFTPSGLSCLLGRAGFTNTRVYARGNAFTVACYKVMALLLPLGLPASHSLAIRIASRASFILLSPVLLLIAILANLSLLGDGGEDCLGYTILSERKS